MTPQTKAFAKDLAVLTLVGVFLWVMIVGVTR